MGTPGPSPSTTLADTLDVFHRLDEPGTPLTSTEVAEKLGCTRRTAFGKLEALAEQGELKSKKAGARSRIWWRPTYAIDDGERNDTPQTKSKQFSAFVRAVQDYAIFTLDPSGSITSWNKGAEQIKGYEEDDVLGEHISVFYTDDAIDRGEPEQNLEDAADRGRIEDEGWRVRKDGSRFWANVTITAVRDDDGTLQGFTKVTRDMTEQHEREKERQALLERMTDAFYALDDEWRFTYVNEQAEEIIQHTEEEVLGKPIWELYPEAEETVAWDEYHEAMETNEPTSFELYYEPLDVWAEIYAYPGDDGLSVFFRDITERIERERALKESERRYRTLAEHFPNGSVNLFDDDLRFTLVAGQALDDLGLSSENIEGQTLREAFGDDIADEIEPAYRAALDGEKDSVEIEYGGREWVVHTAPVSDEHGEVFAGMAMAQDITDRKERERELEQYETLVGAVPDAVYMLDASGHVQFVNHEALQEITGYTEEELTGIHFSVLMDVDDVEKSQDAVGELLSSKTETEKVSYDLVIRGPDKHVPCENHMAVLTDPEGEFQAVVGVLRNIAERKENERELEQYKTAVDVASDVFITIDEQSTIQAVNPAIEDIFGYDSDELVDEPLTTLMPERLRGRHHDGIRRYLETGERNIDWAQIELPGQHKEGHEIPLAISFSEYEHDGDRFFVGVIRDNTEQKAYERELETRIRQQQVVTDLGQRALENPDLDVLFDEAVEAVADTLDNAYSAVLDLHPDDELLVRAGVGLKEEYVGEAAIGTGPDSQAGYTLESETPIVVEDLHTEERFSGPPLLTEHDVVSGISTIIGPDHDPWGVLGTHDTSRREFTKHDVNFVQSVANILASAIERKQFETRLSETVQKLEESNERLEQFAYVASHDMQEPLRMVSSYLQLLERRYADDLDDDAQEFIDFAVDGADRMKAMIEDLLDYSRLDTQGKEFELTDCNVVLEDTLENLRLSVEEADAEITADTLPTVEGDPDQLGQLFQNLISNAIKYRGDEPPRIAIEVDRRGDEWQFSVTDNGIGIDLSQTDRIFQIFNRLHSTDEYSGTGIGLAMCQKIVERHGGDIWVESQPGDGSTFSFTLPVAQPTTEDESRTDYDE